ncbi:Hypothetical protein D9617_71g039860 [Elsinoe fawcettii]|nr:Hypothetical protein D9617_71g039860 [Elsinoe fawcettii]
MATLGFKPQFLPSHISVSGFTASSPLAQDLDSSFGALSTSENQEVHAGTGALRHLDREILTNTVQLAAATSQSAAFQQGLYDLEDSAHRAGQLSDSWSSLRSLNASLITDTHVAHIADLRETQTALVDQRVRRRQISEEVQANVDIAQRALSELTGPLAEQRFSYVFEQMQRAVLLLQHRACKREIS